MRPLKITLQFTLTFTLLLLVQNASAETLILKNGDTLDGDIISETNSSIEFDFGYGKMTFNKSDIAEIAPSVMTSQPEVKIATPKTRRADSHIKTKKNLPKKAKLKSEINIEEEMTYFVEKFFGSISNFEKAFEEFKRLVASDPENIDARYKLGLSYYYLSEFSKAISELSLVLKKQPENMEAIRFIGYSYYKYGDMQKAAFYLNKRLKVYKQEFLTRMCLADIYYRTNRPEEALLQYKRLLEYEKQKERILSRIVSLYERLDNTQLAVKYENLLSIEREKKGLTKK